MRSTSCVRADPAPFSTLLNVLEAATPPVHPLPEPSLAPAFQPRTPFSSREHANTTCLVHRYRVPGASRAFVMDTAFFYVDPTRSSGKPPSDLADVNGNTCRRRRHHNKTRSGCTACKKRRVKVRFSRKPAGKGGRSPVGKYSKIAQR